MITILYIHGLESKLSSEKRLVLERYGKVHAPDLDYEKEPDSIFRLYNQFKDSKIDVVIGSSMGGFAGYHLAKLLQVRALLFNPALAKRSVVQHIPTTPETNGAAITFVLGAQDDVVNPQDTFTYLGGVLSHPQNYSIHMRHDLKHRIPYHVFEEEVNFFLNNPK